MTSSWFDLGSTSKTLNFSLLRFNERSGSENHAWEKSWSKSAIWPLWEKHKWELQLEEVQSVWRNREKHSESVREWKRKNVTFFFAQVTHKENKLMKFLWSFWVLQPWRVGVFRGRFCYWLCGEIVFTLLDLFVVYPIYCGLNFSINLIVVISIS